MQPLYYPIIAITLLSAAGCRPSSEMPESMLVDSQSGEEIYEKACAECHGEAGEGDNPGLIPSVAGLPDYYVVQEMEKFRDTFTWESKPNSRSCLSHDTQSGWVRFTARRVSRGPIISKNTVEPMAT